MANHEINKDSEIAPVIDGMKAIASAIGNLPHDQAQYRGDYLSKDYTDTLGTYTYERNLIDDGGRARIQEEIDAGGRLMLVVKDGDKRKVVGIGRTPDEFRQEKGGQFVIGAGRDGINMPVTDDYFMLVDQGLDDTPPKPFYVSAEQLNGVSVGLRDEDVTLNEHLDTPTSGRSAIRITGTVESVSVLEYRQRY